jgi:hypothetical protein
MNGHVREMEESLHASKILPSSYCRGLEPAAIRRMSVDIVMISVHAWPPAAGLRDLAEETEADVTFAL